MTASKGDLPEPSLLPANATDCPLCEQAFDVEAGDDPTTCPECEDVAQPIHASSAALGYDDDRDFYHWERKQYEYPASDQVVIQ